MDLIRESLEAQGPTLCFFCLDDLGKKKHRDVIKISFFLFFLAFIGKTKGQGTTSYPTQST